MARIDQLAKFCELNKKAIDIKKHIGVWGKNNVQTQICGMQVADDGRFEFQVTAGLAGVILDGKQVANFMPVSFDEPEEDKLRRVRMNMIEAFGIFAGAHRGLNLEVVRVHDLFAWINAQLGVKAAVSPIILPS